MQEKKIKFTDVLFVGLAFFASYFGAGNLIFPPMLGLQSGSNWLSGMIGMLASGVGLPILAIIVLGMCGSVQNLRPCEQEVLHRHDRRHHDPLLLCVHPQNRSRRH